MTILGPVWAVGAFILAVGFLAVPGVLLDGKTLAALSTTATSKARLLLPFFGRAGPRIGTRWSRLVDSTSRSIPVSRDGTRNADTSHETIQEAKP